PALTRRYGRWCGRGSTNRCWSHHHEEVRIYALFRIKQARLRKETFTRPEGFAVETYIDPSFGVFVNEGAVDIAVRFDGEAASKIPERRWHYDQEVERLRDGGIIVRFRTNQQSQVLFWVSQWGPNAEILEPPELRVRARDVNGTIYTVEVQALPEAAFRERALYYWAQAYAGQLGKSQDYTLLCPVVGVNVVDFTIFPDSQPVHTTFHLTPRHTDGTDDCVGHDSLILTSHLAIHFLELPKLGHTRSQDAEQAGISTTLRR
nr:Rpn family recombination-promoting nuclease/putative transposase [Spirochaeta sp.]